MLGLVGVGEPGAVDVRSESDFPRQHRLRADMILTRSQQSGAIDYQYVYSDYPQMHLQRRSYNPKRIIGQVIAATSSSERSG